MHHVTRRIIAPLAVLVGVLALTACEEQPASQQQETDRQQSSYDALTAAQPADTMQYSPTRETINYWIETWDEPNKLSYVYLQASNGQLVGYYVFKGLPVSYCASLTPNYRVVGGGTEGAGRVVTPAPAMDGVYYGGSGACNTYYGRDATTDSYMEYTVGTGINALIYEQPLPRQDIEPLGFSRVEDIE